MGKLQLDNFNFDIENQNLKNEVANQNLIIQDLDELTKQNMGVSPEMKK